MAVLLRLGDDQLILSHRISEWCGHAPSLEEDLALSNIALDLIGQARPLYAHAATLDGKGRDEDALAYLRLEHDYANCQLVEQPNHDFAHTIVRQLFFSAFMAPFWETLRHSTDDTISAVANKAVKEVAYHLRHASEWAIRLGDGTVESRARMIEALDELTPYTGELFERDDVLDAAIVEGVAADPEPLRETWTDTITSVLARADLALPTDAWMQTGGRRGHHTEAMGHLLAQMQYMQRAYPNMTW